MGNKQQESMYVRMDIRDEPLLIEDQMLVDVPVKTRSRLSLLTGKFVRTDSTTSGLLIEYLLHREFKAARRRLTFEEILNVMERTEVLEDFVMPKAYVEKPEIYLTPKRIGPQALLVLCSKLDKGRFLDTELWVTAQRRRFFARLFDKLGKRGGKRARTENDHNSDEKHEFAVCSLVTVAKLLGLIVCNKIDCFFFQFIVSCDALVQLAGTLERRDELMFYWGSQAVLALHQVYGMLSPRVQRTIQDRENNRLVRLLQYAQLELREPKVVLRFLTNFIEVVESGDGASPLNRDQFNQDAVIQWKKVRSRPGPRRKAHRSQPCHRHPRKVAPHPATHGRKRSPRT